MSQRLGEIVKEQLAIARQAIDNEVRKFQTYEDKPHLTIAQKALSDASINFEAFAKEKARLGHAEQKSAAKLARIVQEQQVLCARMDELETYLTNNH